MENLLEQRKGRMIYFNRYFIEELILEGENCYVKMSNETCSINCKQFAHLLLYQLKYVEFIITRQPNSIIKTISYFFLLLIIEGA